MDGGTTNGHLKALLLEHKSGLTLKQSTLDAHPVLRGVLPQHAVIALDNGLGVNLDVRANAQILWTSPRLKNGS